MVVSLVTDCPAQVITLLTGRRVLFPVAAIVLVKHQAAMFIRLSLIWQHAEIASVLKQ